MPAARLELTWPNKDRFLLVPKDEDGKPVWVERDHPAAAEVRIHDFGQTVGQVDDANPYGDNLLFTGDSLDVLRILTEVPEFRREYRGKVKLIYIDPPFNTGQTFTHYDDWMEHSTWLSFMRDRLVLAKELLAPNGSVWVHLDNYEVHRMRMLMDEIFGPQNFINTVVWKRTTAKSVARRGMGTMYDAVIVFGKSDLTQLNPVLLPYSQEYIDSEYRLEDERGRYCLGDLTAPGKRTGDSGLPWRGIDPSVRNRHWAAPLIPGVTDGDAQQLSTRDRLELLDEAGYLFWRPTPGSVPRFKRYLDPNGGVLLGDVWMDIPTPNSRDRERNGYDTQKPEALLARVIGMGSNPGDIVVDVFGGSGTTAAVAHKMGRRWVTTEILSETVAGFTQPRLKSVVAGEDGGGITESAGWLGGGGFRTVTVGPSMYEVTPFGVLLADWATNGRFARAVAGQLGFEWQTTRYAPFCGVRGRMRLAVLDGAVGEEEIRQIVAALGKKERVTVVAKSVLPGAEELLTKLSPGSKVRKAPRDVLAPARARRTRKAVA